MKRWEHRSHTHAALCERRLTTLPGPTGGKGCDFLKQAPRIGAQALGYTVPIGAQGRASQDRLPERGPTELCSTPVFPEAGPQGRGPRTDEPSYHANGGGALSSSICSPQTRNPSTSAPSEPLTSNRPVLSGHRGPPSLSFCKLHMRGPTARVSAFQPSGSIFSNSPPPLPDS